MSDGDWERPAEPDPPDEDVAPESDEDVAWASDEVEEPEDRRGTRASGRRNDRRGKSRDKVERTEHDKWRRWAWAALVFSVLGVIWGLTLSTILLDRSGDNTAELIGLFEESQERRDALARQTAQNQAEKQAALKATQAESQAFRARSQAARASGAESNASARRAQAQAALAGARTQQVERTGRELPSPSGVQRSLDRTIDLQQSLDRTADLQRTLDRNADLQRTLERNIDLLRTLERSIDLQRTVDRTRDLQTRLKEAVDALRQAISELRPRP